MATGSAAPPTAQRTEDQRVTLHDVSWADFEVILQIRGDRAGVRVAYLNGVLEGLIEVSALIGDRYVRQERSGLLPDLDVTELARHIDPENQTESVKRYRQTLRGARSPGRPVRRPLR